MILQRAGHRLGKNRDAVFAPLAVAHDDLRVLEIEVFDAQAQRRRDSPPDRQVGQERLDLWRAHVGWMPFTVIQNEPLDPANVRLFRSIAEMASTHFVAY